MITVALERIMEQKDLDVEFEVCDATVKEYAENAFDVVYSRDTLLHIEDKLHLSKKFHKWLKPGGKLLISDYCCGSQDHSDEFNQYVAGRGYFLKTPGAYGDDILKAGFHNAVVEDRTSQFVNILSKELERTRKIRDSFIHD